MLIIFHFLFSLAISVWSSSGFSIILRHLMLIFKFYFLINTVINPSTSTNSSQYTLSWKGWHTHYNGRSLTFQYVYICKGSNKIHRRSVYHEERSCSGFPHSIRPIIQFAVEFKEKGKNYLYFSTTRKKYYTQIGLKKKLFQSLLCNYLNFLI